MNQVVSLCVLGCAVIFVVGGSNIGISKQHKHANSSDIVSKCNETYHIKMEYLQDLNDTGSFSDETEKSPMCFIQCYLEKLKVLNENGEINKEVAIAMYQIDNEETVDACNNEMVSASITDSCGKAYFFLRCIMTAALIDDKNQSEEAI